jgi:hypothetical protein
MVMSDRVPQRIKPCIMGAVIWAPLLAPASATQNIKQHPVNASMKIRVGIRVFRKRVNIDNYSEVK